MASFIHSFIHLLARSFIQQMVIEHLVSARERAWNRDVELGKARCLLTISQWTGMQGREGNMAGGNAMGPHPGLEQQRWRL